MKKNTNRIRFNNINIFLGICSALAILLLPSCKNIGIAIITAIQEQNIQAESNSHYVCYKATDFICEIETEIHRLVNKHRVSNRKSRLEHHYGICFVSRQWSSEQASRGAIGHDGFNRVRNQVYQSEFNKLDISMSRENVSSRWLNSCQNRDPKFIAKLFVDSWLKSPGHKANIMADGIKLHGTGVFRKGNEYYATQIFGNNLSAACKNRQTQW